jgi:putative hydrolase of the HAD superfamily
MSSESLWDGIESIVLDAVGTLIEPSPPVADVYAEAAQRQGVAIAREEVRGRFHQAFRRDEDDESRGPLETDEATEHRRWRRIVADVLPEVPDPERAFRELWEHFGDPRAWQCFPDVGPAIAAFRKSGLIVRIASNFDARLHGVIRGLPELADTGVPIISSEVGYRKPHPEFYRAVCTCLERSPGRILSVGDDVENDVRGACQAGLRGVWIDRKWSEAGGPWLRARTLTEVPEALAR